MKRLSKKEISERIRKARKSKGMTQRALAAAAGGGVCWQHVSRWENGVMPDVPNALLLARVLGTTAEKLFTPPTSRRTGHE